MPSVKNPNRPSRNRLAARAASSRKKQQKRSAAGQIGAGVARADTTRGARPGLLPTSGPRAPLSAKKQKKLIQRMTLALKRKMAAGEHIEGLDEAAEQKETDATADKTVEMTDVAETTAGATAETAKVAA